MMGRGAKFFAGVLVILLFLTRSFKEFEEISGSSRTFGSFSTNYHLTLGFPFVAHCIVARVYSLLLLHCCHYHSVVLVF